MEIVLSPNAYEDLEYWKRTHNQKMLQRIRLLIEDIQKSPFRGIGKPEPLKHNHSGTWSRRLNSEHRMIYEITSNTVTIHSLRDHY